MGLDDVGPLDLSAFDVLVLHYSLVITADGYVSPRLRERIRAFQGLKVQFLQDEYRWVDEITAMMRFLEIDVLFSIVPEREIENVYGGRIPDVTVVPTLAGYVPDELVGHSVLSLSQRWLDVGYRGRVLPFWNGALSQEKVEIARGVLERIGPYGLRHDIAWAESDRLYGRRWIRFLASCRTTLGTESGTSITDFDGSVERAVRSYLAERPRASFAEVSREVLAPYEGNVMMNVVSPRVFEAAALRTAMVLFPGHYGGTVRPWEHYVPLEKDYSNFDQVVEAIRDSSLLERLTECAYEEFVASGLYSLRNFVRQFDDVVAERVGRPAAHGSHRLRNARMHRLRQTGTYGGYNPRRLRRALLESLATLGLLARDETLRALLSTYARNAELRASVRLGRLAEDLLRLGILRRAHAGTPVTLERFALTSDFDAESRALTLVGVSYEAALAVREPAVTWGELRTIIWDNRNAGAAINCRYAPRRWLGLPVGYYGESGIHHFGALAQLGVAAPALLRAALEPIVRPPEPLKPMRQPRRIAFRWPGALRTPRNYTAKLALVGGILASEPSCRAILVQYLRRPSMRRQVGLRCLLEDILKVHVLATALAGRVPSVPGLAVRKEAGELLFCTTPDVGPELRPPSLANVSRLVWDHSSVGVGVVYPSALDSETRVALGDSGRHEFPALTVLLPHLPASAIEDLLTPAAGSGRNSARDAARVRRR